jgi:hypothetical protein
VGILGKHGDVGWNVRELLLPTTLWPVLHRLRLGEVIYLACDNGEAAVVAGVDGYRDFTIAVG